jgi:JmjC domain, hydroxylase
MDVTDALNRMLWAAKSPDGEPGCTKWEIFDAIDAALLRKFLIECGIMGPGDPIHSQMVYLTPHLLKLLFEKYGIRPYTIFQYPGDVVLIPAYCAHQVANCADAIKIACDFISVENLNRTHRLVGELRHQRLSHSWDEDGIAWGEDEIELEKSLYYAYTSLSRRYKTTTIIQPSHPASTSFSVFQNQSPMPIDVDDSLPSQFQNHNHNIASSSALPVTTSTSISIFVDQPPMLIDIDNSLPLSFGQSQNNDNVTSNSALPTGSSSHQNMHNGHADRVTSKLSETQRQKRREKTKIRKLALRVASKTAERDTRPDHKFICPAPLCARRFNRTGVLDRVYVYHSIIFFYLWPNLTNQCIPAKASILSVLTSMMKPTRHFANQLLRKTNSQNDCDHIC